MTRIILAAIATAMLGGCAGLMVSDLGAPPAVDAKTLLVVDKRSPEQKERRRSSTMAPLVVLGEDNVNPPALLFLRSALQKHRPDGSTLSLQIDEFHVIDFFPKRLKGAMFATSGWLTGLIIEEVIHSNTDWSFVDKVGVPTDRNSIVCLFSGTINGKAVNTALYEEYDTTPMAVSIRNDPAFKQALLSAINRTARLILAQGGQLGQPAR
jgi:hypothetical protein